MANLRESTLQKAQQVTTAGEYFSIKCRQIVIRTTVCLRITLLMLYRLQHLILKTYQTLLVVRVFFAVWYTIYMLCLKTIGSKINGGVLEVVMGVVVWISHPTLFGYRKKFFFSQTWSFERLWRRRQEISVLISNPCPNYPAEYCQVCANRNFKSK